MSSVAKLMDICSRIDHLETCSQWITKETVHSDNGICQTATLISVLADEVRERIYEMVQELETEAFTEKLN